MSVPSSGHRVDAPSRWHPWNQPARTRWKSPAERGTGRDPLQRDRAYPGAWHGRATSGRRPRRDPGVPHHPPGQDHPRAGRAARLRRRPPAGAGPAPRGGRRSWPGSAPSTTPGSSAATPPASPTACSTRSPTPCSSTTPNARTCSTCSAPPATHPPPRRRPAAQQSGPRVQRILDSMTGTPAFVLNGRLDILAANALGRALYSPVYADPARPANNARFVFLDPHAHRVLPRLGQGRRRHRRHAARRSRPRPLRPAPVGPDRASCPPAATTSASAGPPTTSGSTPPASSSSTTRSSATSTCPSSPSRLARRPRPEPAHLHRRARFALARRTEPARQLGHQPSARQPSEPARQRPAGPAARPRTRHAQRIRFPARRSLRAELRGSHPRACRTRRPGCGPSRSGWKRRTSLVVVDRATAQVIGSPSSPGLAPSRSRARPNPPSPAAGGPVGRRPDMPVRPKACRGELDRRGAHRRDETQTG